MPAPLMVWRGLHDYALRATGAYGYAQNGLLTQRLLEHFVKSAHNIHEYGAG